MTDWDQSAPAWIAQMGDSGDPTRADVLDAPMIAALPGAGHALDVGCGEGRFCRMMQAAGLTTVGLDLTADLLDAARRRDPQGSYVNGNAETLPFPSAQFDVAVSYLSLIDIPDFRAAITETARVLKPGGRFLIANLHAHATARPRDWGGEGGNWAQDRKFWCIDDMMKERANWASWAGIRIRNYHRPLSAYMTACLDAGFRLTQFTDPSYTGQDPEIADKFNRMPWAFMMVWDKPLEDKQ